MTGLPSSCGHRDTPRLQAQRRLLILDTSCPRRERAQSQHGKRRNKYLAGKNHQTRDGLRGGRWSYIQGMSERRNGLRKKEGRLFRTALGRQRWALRVTIA